MLMTTIQTLACPQIYHQYYHVIWPNFDKRIFANLIQNHHLHLVTYVNDLGLEQISQEFCEFQHAFCEEVELKGAMELT